MSDAARILPRLVGRVDDIEAKTTAHGAAIGAHTEDLGSIGERLDDHASRIEALETTARAAKPVDWLTITDPVAASAHLVDLAAWNDGIAAYLDARVPYTCWPWHPLIVAEVGALKAHRDLVYRQGHAHVSDWYRATLPPFRQRVLDPARWGMCVTGWHDHDGHPYVADPALIPDYATWWATTRDSGDLPPGLTPRADSDAPAADGTPTDPGSAIDVAVNWLTVTDPDEAARSMTTVVEWHDTILKATGGNIPYACWPWHPLLFMETLTLYSFFRYATAAGSPAAISDWVTRLDAYRRRIESRRGDCMGAIHDIDGKPHTYDVTRLPEYARWWVINKGIPLGGRLPPGLTPQDR